MITCAQKSTSFCTVLLGPYRTHNCPLVLPEEGLPSKSPFVCPAILVVVNVITYDRDSVENKVTRFAEPYLHKYPWTLLTRYTIVNVNKQCSFWQSLFCESAFCCVYRLCVLNIYIYIFMYIYVGIKYITLIGTTSEAYQLALFHQLSSQRIYLCYFVVPSTPRSGRIRLPRSHNRDYYGITVTEIVDWDTCTRMSKSIALKATYRYFNILYTLILLPILPIVITKQTRLKTRLYGMRSNIFIASSWCFQSTICHFCNWINLYQLCNKLIIQYVYIYTYMKLEVSRNGRHGIWTTDYTLLWLCLTSWYRNQSNAYGSYAVFEFRIICYARYLWKLVPFCLPLRILCPPDPWNLPGAALLCGFRSLRGALKYTKYDST